jgi:hypothetical protein
MSFNRPYNEMQEEILLTYLAPKEVKWNEVKKVERKRAMEMN